MTTRKIALTALGAALLLATTAPMTMAAPRGGPDRDGPHMRPEAAFVYLLKVADTNKDGKITKEEFAARQDALFTDIDQSKDGSITPKEMRDYRRAKMEEFRAANPRPERADAKGPEGKGGPEHAERDGKRHEGRKHEARMEGGKGRHGGRFGGMFAMADTDGNGQISKAEFTAAGEKMFARMDTNKDGAINIDDMPARPFL